MITVAMVLELLVMPMATITALEVKGKIQMTVLSTVKKDPKCESLFLSCCVVVIRYAVKRLEKKFVGNMLEGLFAMRIEHEYDIYSHLGRSLNVAYLYGAYEVRGFLREQFLSYPPYQLRC